MMMFAMHILMFCNMRRLLKRALELNKTSGNSGFAFHDFFKVPFYFIFHSTLKYGCETKSAVRSSGKHERSMLIQAAVVCGVMEIEIICFHFLLKFAVKLAGKKAEIPVNIFINCYAIFNNVVLPTVNLIFVKRFRTFIKHIFKKLLFNMTKTERIRTAISIH
ncbi:unnamed protein product [Brugia timori]|uniref:G_PROTEIN_RECEP_F1_2 domain-containing protein n=1 Tax=Brugia timori TaxID=42155 RepID=A0A0R3Q807_9BILA|nr:unnamed protein product [Brugia timori]